MDEEYMSQGIGTTGGQNKEESSKAPAAHTPEDLIAPSGLAEDYRDKAEQGSDDAKMPARTFREDGEDYVRENPMRAVFTALGIGFVLGWIIRH